MKRAVGGMVALLVAGMAGLRGADPLPPSPRSASAATAASAKPAVPLEQSVKARLKKLLDETAQGGDFDSAVAAAETLFEQTLAWAGPRDAEAVREAAFARRLLSKLQQVPENERGDLLVFLRGHDGLARSLVFLMQSQDRPGEVFGLLRRLKETRGEALEKYATLTAAICVVHQRPLSRRVNENKVTAGDPGVLWDYYAGHEKQMFFGLRDVPAELLVWVVDTTASVEELTWALGKYARDPAVGRHFFDIAYDHESLRTGREKQVTKAGYNLPNILKYGGVCADQAYFAMSVGKAIGVPTAYAAGDSAEGGHAWVGFLEAQGKQGWWNLNIGRYEEYRGVRGFVFDAHARAEVPEGFVSLSAELIGTSPAQRQIAAAWTDAAARLHALGQSGRELNVAPLPDGVAAERQAPRKTGVEAEQELLRLALDQSRGYLPAWAIVQALAREGDLTLDQKKMWADVILKLCGQRYPDFALTLLEPMIETVANAKEQNGLWNAAFSTFGQRSELAASVRMSQAKLWEKEKQPLLAGQCYLDVVERYANAGPFVIPALAGAEQMLRQSNRGDKVVLLYEQTWNRIARPRTDTGPFARQSNWYQVGMLLAQKLGEAGQEGRANDIKVKIGADKPAR